MDAAETPDVRSEIMSDGRFGIDGKPRNRIGERMSVTIPDSDDLAIGDDETPSASLTTPSGTVDLDPEVVFLPAVPAGAKDAGAPARWQVLTVPLSEVGEHTLTFAGKTFTTVVVDEVNPRKKRREARTRAEAAAGGNS